MSRENSNILCIHRDGSLSAKEQIAVRLSGGDEPFSLYIPQTHAAKACLTKAIAMPIKLILFAAVLLLVASGSFAATRVPTGKHTLNPKIDKAIPSSLKGYLLPPVFCGKLVRIDYKGTEPEPTYFDNTTGEIVAKCDNPLAQIPADKRVKCPPVQWTCD